MPRARRPTRAGAAEERAERLTTLSGLTRSIASATDSDAAFRAIAEAATTLLKAKTAYVWVDEGGETLREGGSFWAGPELAGRSVHTDPVPRDASLAGAVLAARRVEYIEDIQRDPRWRHRDLAERSDLHGCLALPLIHQGKAVGALIVAFGRRGGVTAEERDLAGLLADQAAIAIENARLYEDAGRRRREAELLTAVVRTINTSLDLEAVLPRIAEGAREICRCDMAFIGLRDAALDTVVFRQWPGARHASYASCRIAPGQGAAGQVLATGRPFRTDSYLEDARIGPEFRAVVTAEGIRAYMVVPITIDERVEGFLAVANRDDRTLADPEEQALLRLADHAAVAINNARLFADNAARRQEAEALAQLGSAIASSLDLQRILSFVVDCSCALLGTQRSAVALLDQEPAGTPGLFIASRGMSRAFGSLRPLHPRDGTTPAAIAERKPVWSADLLNDPVFDLTPSTRAAVEAEGYRGVLSVPLLVGDRVLGALVTYRDEPGPFSDRQVELLQAFGDQAALALENARLYEESERRRRESEVLAEAARASEARKGAIVTAALDCIITIDGEGHIVEFNPAAEKTFGYTGAEALGRDLGELTIPPSLRERYRRELSRYLPTGEGLGIGRRFELTVMRADGTEFPAEIAITAIASDGPPLFTGFLRDLSERKRAEEALRQSEAQLRQSQKMDAVGRLAGGVAHDFNNLLTVITGRTELLLLRSRADDPRRRDIELVRRTADRAAALTQQLLAFSRKQMLQMGVLDLNGVVAGLAQMLKPLLGETVDLVTRLDPTLGRVKADGAQIEQIVVNLAVNARDAMPQGGRLTIETANVELDSDFVEIYPGASTGPHALLRVRDTGTGMTPEVQAHIFEPFFTTKGVGKGTGLGLATVYGIVKQHGGYIAIESAPGAGTAVSIYLARVAGPGDGVESAGSDAAPVAGSGTVLVVEDAADLRELTAEILGMAGYTVLSAGAPGEALEIATRHAGAIDLLLTDVVMPEMSGRDLADRLTAARPEMKVLYMSGYTDDAIVHHGVLDPGTALLQKPFTPDALTRRVGDLLSG